jgi:putative hydrolase of the HAD superfamily
MARSPFSAVLFDLDDTLLDRRSAYEHFYRQLYEAHPQINRVSSWPEAREFFWSLSPNNAHDPRSGIRKVQARWPGVPGEPDEHYRTYYEGIVSAMTELPGARAVMDGLNASGTPWGVVTNGGPYQYRKVEATGLTGVIPALVVSGTFGREKPDPAIFREAARLIGLNGTSYSKVLFVGDNPYTDIAGAHGVGMRTAWVRMGREYPSDAPRPDMVIDSVTELRGVLGLG